MKWLDKLNERAPDDFKLNLLHTVFWAIAVGVMLGVAVVFG